MFNYERINQNPLLQGTVLDLVLTYEQNVDNNAHTPHVNHLIVRVILQDFRRDVCWRTTPIIFQ